MLKEIAKHLLFGLSEAVVWCTVGWLLYQTLKFHFPSIL